MSPRPAPRSLRNLRDDRSGASALIVGVSMVAVMGVVGLGTDIGTWYGARREAQNAADSAAVSAAAASVSGAGDITGQARAIAAGYGLKNGVDGVQVTVNTLPNDRIEVIVQRPARRFLSGLIVKAAAGPIRARAVASIGGSGNGCVLALNPSAERSVLVNGNPDVNLAGCSLYVNSTNNSGLSMNGSAEITAQSVELAAGGYFRNGSASINAKDGIHYSQSPAADPYAGVAAPTFTPSCDGKKVVDSAWTFNNINGQPRVFCNGLTIQTSGPVRFEPGVYVFDRGQFLINGNATVIGKDVTFFFTSTTGSDYATFRMNGNATLELSAPTTGPRAGLLLFQDRRAPDGHETHINGNADGYLSGAIYFPRQQVRFNGGASIGSGRCVQLIADTIEFNGNANFQINCPDAGLRAIGGRTSMLVE